MKIRPETRWILITLLVFGSASLFSSLWVFRERARAHRAFVEREDSLLRTVASLKEELSEAKAKGLELEAKLVELRETLDRRVREVESLEAKYQLVVRDKETLKAETMKHRDEKLALEEKVRQLYASPFLVKLISEKKGFEADVEGLKRTVEESRDELVRITEERNALESRIEEIQAAKVQLEDRLQKEQGKITTMTEALDKERAGRLSVAESLSENFSRVKREKEALQSELSRVTQEKIELEQEMDQVRDRVQEINQKRDELATQVKEINQVLETRLREINQIRETYEKTIDETRQIVRVERDVVELPPIVVKGSSPPPESTPETSTLAVSKEPVIGEAKNGKIVVVNRQHNFVVIDLGRDSGIEEGMRFHVFRDGQELGLLKVTEVRQKISACDVVKQIPPHQLAEGDLVIY